ncbi:MAG: hypothetical protein KIT27_04000, partial [Legionellales bacterium]|nr:hypothetical protein [Legionellales bacterium]
MVTLANNLQHDENLENAARKKPFEAIWKTLAEAGCEYNAIKNVYYPFAGVDVLLPLLIFPNCSTLTITGANHFGITKNGISPDVTLEKLDKIYAAFNLGYDQSRDLAMMGESFPHGLRIAPVVVQRLRKVLGAKITEIRVDEFENAYPQNPENINSIDNSSKKTTADPFIREYCQQCTINFTLGDDNTSREIRIIPYFINPPDVHDPTPHDYVYNNPIVTSALSQLDPDVVILKAIPGLFKYPDFLKVALGLVYRENQWVISDQCCNMINESIQGAINKPNPVFKENAIVHSLNLSQFEDTTSNSPWGFFNRECFGYGN